MKGGSVSVLHGAKERRRSKVKRVIITFRDRGRIKMQRLKDNLDEFFYKLTKNKAVSTFKSHH